VTGPASTLQRSIVGVTMNAKKRMRGSSVLSTKAGPKLTAAEKDAIAARAALANAIEEHGVLIVDEAAKFPRDVTTVSKEQSRAAFEAADASSRSPDALRMAFNRS
jgi:hypothetical protein